MNRYNVAQEFQGLFTERRSRTRYIVVHHAAALYPTGTGIEDVRAVARYHLGKGWSGIGYHIALAEETNGGAIARYDLSDLDLQRAHIWGRNHECVGVSCLTNFTGMPAQKWIDALAEVLRELVERYPQAEIVGHREITLPGRGTVCPGPAWLRWKPQLLESVASRLIMPDALTADSPILAAPRSTVEQCVRYILRQPTGGYTATDVSKVIVPVYFRVASAVGLDPLIAIAQMIHETGYLQSYWSQRPRRNPAGIGVTGEPGKGNSFSTWEHDAIPAHVGRLLAYALPVGTGTAAQRALIDQALHYRGLPGSYRGIAPTLRGLNGTWAVPGRTYGQRLAEIANAIRAA